MPGEACAPQTDKLSSLHSPIKSTHTRCRDNLWLIWPQHWGKSSDATATWISNHISGLTVIDLIWSNRRWSWAWMSNYIPYKTVDVTTYQYANLSQSMLVKWALNTNHMCRTSVTWNLLSAACCTRYASTDLWHLVQWPVKDIFVILILQHNKDI